VSATGGIVMLAGPGESTRIVFHALQSRVPIRKVVIEQPVSRRRLLQRRARKLGWRAAGGQLVFSGLVVPILRRASRHRAAELKRRFHFRDDPIPEALVVSVPSANSDETVRLLQELAPRAILINGTRLIERRVLEQVPATFINMHAGITPRYRGVHGAYWALAQADLQHCGVTVHLVDTGIDTGAVIHQATIVPEPEDTFVTYPYLQLNAGIPLLERALNDALAGRLSAQPAAPAPSRLWSHPTAWGYLANWVLRGVR
jgi:folate-dependent phosphoribosylglycinamide formyltransferase PurN